MENNGNTPYKVEPKLKEVLDIIEECEAIAEKFEIEPLPPEVEHECP